MRRCWYAIGLAALLVDALVSADSPPKTSFELRGKISFSKDIPFANALAVVFLQGSTTPFTTRTVADRGGEFKFKNLLPGMYTLIVAVPRRGELKQTIEVGPSHADAKGRIEVDLLFEPKDSPADSHQVAVSQLSIPEGALKEYDKALARLEKRDVEKAIEHLNRAVQIAPKFSSAWNHLGTISYQTQKYADAENYFREALRHDPESFAPLVNLGGALLSLGKAEESLPVNLQAVDARPDDALAHSQLGQSYFYVGQLDQAAKHLKQAKALDPAHFSHPQLVLAEIYGRRGDLSSTIGELEEFLRYHPDSKMAPGIRQGIEKARSLLKNR